MSPRAICHCPLCRLERFIISGLEVEDGVRWFRNLTTRITSLSSFTEMSELVSYVHSSGQDPETRLLCDEIYVDLLRELPTTQDRDRLQALLLRLLIPALHRQYRLVALSFSRLYHKDLAQDLAQQLIMNCLQVAGSPGIQEKTAYVAHSIVERTKRNTIRWAIQQYRGGEREETGTLVEEYIESDAPPFEVEVQLADALEKGIREKVITAEERDLLIAYEVEGHSGKALGSLAGLDPKALSHRARRALERLNRAFGKSPKDSRRHFKDPAA